MDNMNEVDLLDKLCDELDNIGIEGNVIERDILNGNPYVVIWPGKFESKATVLTEELFFVHICANRQFEVLPSVKYRRYFGEHFWSCRSEKRGYYIMTFLKLVGTIEYLFKKENNMNKIAEEATKELCHIIGYEAPKSPLRWTDTRDDSTVGCGSIFIHNMANSDKVCRVRIYETSLKNSPTRAYYYVYFTDKYGSIAKEIREPRIVGTTETNGYKFVSPRHVVDFVREVVQLKERGGVLKDCTAKEEPIMMKWEVQTPDLPTFKAVDVIFNDPATIIIWADGSKTVVKAENEPFDPEKGLAMAISKKVLGNKYDYYDVFKKYVGRYEKKQKKGKK